MTRCDQDCRYDAVHGTTRCLQHWDPAQRAAPINAPARVEPAKVDVPGAWPYAEIPQVMPPARPYLKPALDAVGFDEPPVRWWLARALAAAWRRSSRRAA